MPNYTEGEKARYLSQARSKVASIRNANSVHVERAREHARAYAEALAYVGAISEENRVDLYDEAQQAFEARMHDIQAAEQASIEATQASADIEVKSALKGQN